MLRKRRTIETKKETREMTIPFSFPLLLKYMADCCLLFFISAYSLSAFLFLLYSSPLYASLFFSTAAFRPSAPDDEQ